MVRYGSVFLDDGAKQVKAIGALCFVGFRFSFIFGFVLLNVMGYFFEKITICKEAGKFIPVSARYYVYSASCKTIHLMRAGY